MIVSIVILLFVLFTCLRRPIYGLALLLQMNIIRAFAELDYDNPCFKCTNDPDFFLGALTPILGFISIILITVAKGKIKYHFDIFDLFFFLCTAIFLFTSIYSLKPIDSVAYSFRFIVLASPFFFVTKLVIINLENHTRDIQAFLRFTLLLSTALGVFGLVFFFYKADQFVIRLTIPGVHPIPFSQLIGLGLFTSFLIFISGGKLLYINSSLAINLNKLIFILLTITLFATNTRGVMLATALAVILYMLINKVKIKKSTLYISGVTLILAIIAIVNYIDVEVLFRRILSPYTSKSEGDRFIAYFDSFELLFQYPFGAGADTFKDLSILPYPHNFFLETISYFGIFGILISLLMLLIFVYMIFMTNKYYSKNIMIVVVFAIFTFYFIETMFSFTLPMHKGLYFSMGLFSAITYHIKSKKRQTNELL